MPRSPRKRPAKPAPTPTPPRTQWREIDPALKLKILANFYGGIQGLSNATGIKAASLRQTLAATNSRRLNDPDYVRAIQKARHGMTDKIRRMDAKLQTGAYKGPLIKLDNTRIEPVVPKKLIKVRGVESEVDSYWTKYYVENIPRYDQFQIAIQIILKSQYSGEFNIFRFEYLTASDEYVDTGIPPRKYYDEEGAALEQQAKINNLIKVSTKVYGIDELGTDEGKILYWLERKVIELIPRGLKDILYLCFSNRHSAYTPVKPKQGKKQWGNKRGK